MRLKYRLALVPLVICIPSELVLSSPSPPQNIAVTLAGDKISQIGSASGLRSVDDDEIETVDAEPDARLDAALVASLMPELMSIRKDLVMLAAGMFKTPDWLPPETEL